jgi:hypothetical protein
MTGDRPSTVDEFVVAVIALGRSHVRWSLALIESLRKNGEFEGLIVVATDRPKDYENAPGTQIHIVASGRSRTRAKLLKTRVLEWATGQYVAYIDADVVIGGCLSDLWSDLKRMLEEKALLVFADSGHGREPWHTGIIMAHRERARGIFDRWHQELKRRRASSLEERLQGGRDQAALAAILRDEQVGQLDPKLLLFPGREEIRELRFATFNHITYTYRRRISTPALLHRYFRALNVQAIPISRLAPMGYLHPLGVRLVGWYKRTFA